MKKSNEKGKINMKKMIAFLLAAVMLLSLTACGGGKDNTPPNNTDKPANSGLSWLRATSSRSTSIWMRMRIM